MSGISIRKEISPQSSIPCTLTVILVAAFSDILAIQQDLNNQLMYFY